MVKLKNIFATKWGIVTVGAFIGIFAALLQKLGNPGNMGVCVACFERDIAGALGLHRAAVVHERTIVAIDVLVKLFDEACPT